MSPHDVLNRTVQSLPIQSRPCQWRRYSPFGLSRIPPKTTPSSHDDALRDTVMSSFRRIYRTNPQRYSCAMIPKTNDAGLLPEGIHWATWAEVEERFAITDWRRTLTDGARRAADNLKASGCKTLYLDGSYVTDKEHPSDFDGCWDTTGVSGQSLDPVLLSFGNRRAAQKAKYHGELFPSSIVADERGTTYLEFFQRDKQTAKPKGIIAIDLEAFP